MKVMICSPLRNSPLDPRFEAARVALLRHSKTRPAELGVGSQSHYIGFNGTRYPLASQALRVGATHILWADGELLFPPDALFRLAGHGHKFVGCNYPHPYGPDLPTAISSHNDRLRRLWTTPAEAEAGIVEQVAGLGLGLCLIAAEVFRALPGTWFSRNDDPVNEDLRFCSSATAAGFPVMVDHALSWEVSCIRGGKVVTHPDILLKKSLWDSVSAKTGSGA